MENIVGTAPDVSAPLSTEKNIIKKTNNREHVYPESFFNIPHPTSPLVLIQFKTGVTSGTKDYRHSDLWTNITFDPNNYFDSLTLEDEGGASKLNLSLKDINHSFLEDKIIRMTQAINEEVKNRSYKTIPVEDEKTGNSAALKSFISPSVSLRLRFGYSVPAGGDKFFSSSTRKGFEERVKNPDKPTTLSPWMYFVLTNIDMNISGEGLSVEIEGIEESGPILNTFEVVNASMQIEDEPLNIIEVLRILLNSTGQKFEIITKDEPLVQKNESGSRKKTLLLAEYEEGKVSFKKLSKILDEFCSLISPIFYDKEGVKIENPESYEELDEAMKKKYKSFNYSWFVSEKDDVSLLTFYYLRPDVDQENIRMYSWLEHGLSVVRELSLNSDYLFSQISLPLFYVDPGGDHTLSTSHKRVDGSYSENLSEELSSSDFLFTFAKGSYTGTNSGKAESNKSISSGKTSRLNANLNNMLHKGSITIQGDPFFLFDNAMVPFMYIINVLVKKPTYINEEGERVGGGSSYLSGDYVISKITHNISSGDFTTNLEILRAL